MLYFCATALIMKYAFPVFFMIGSPAQLVADVVSVEAAELAHQFLRSFVEHAWQHQPHLDDEIAARAAAGRRNAALAETESLARLCPGRDAQPRVAFERRHLDLGAERRF